MTAVESILGIVLRASLVLLLTAVVVEALLRTFRIASPWFHRRAAILVLLQGWLIVPVTLSIPWYDPLPNAVPSDNAAVAGDFLAEPDRMTASQLTPSPAVSSPADLPEVSTASTVNSVRWSSWVRRSVPEGVLSIWCIGMLVLFGSAVWRYARFFGTLARIKWPNEEWQREWSGLLTARGIRRPITLGVTENTGPMLCLLPTGYYVLVPHSFWSSLCSGQRLSILLHELSHYERGDVWKAWLTFLLALPHWFNPAAWWAVRRFRHTSEWLSDGAAAATSGGRIDYMRALRRLAEMHSPRGMIAGHGVHTHPLVARIRRLAEVPHMKEQKMKKVAFSCICLTMVLVHLIRVELVARAAEPSPEESLKARVEALEVRLQEVKQSAARLRGEGKELSQKIDGRLAELKALVKDESQLSEDARRRVALFTTGEEAKQLAALQDIAKLKDEGVILTGAALKESPFEAVRRAGLEAAASMGDDGFVAIAFAYESLTEKDLLFLVEQLGKQKNANNVFPFLLMWKEGSNELRQALLKASVGLERRLVFIAAIAEESSEQEGFVTQLIDLAGKMEGDDGVAILYAIAKSDEATPELVIAAVKQAAARKHDGLPVLVAAFEHDDPNVRASIVRSAKAIGGEAANLVVEHALRNGNDTLRRGAEEALKSGK